jgi:dolichol-phosphate mannosyltransferase
VSFPGPFRLLVSLATYNERDNLGPLLTEIKCFAPDADVLVIDDNSPDGTGQVADEWAATHSWVHVLHRPGKLGLGTATLAAVRYALENDYDYLLNMDADFSHHPRYLPTLLAGMDRNDVMIGSRYVKGGGTENWPLSRRCISTSVNLLVRFLMGLPAHDCSGAFRCYRLSKLRRARLDRIISRGYSFQQEMLFRCFRAGCKIGETPIIFENRRAGVSKVNLFEATRSLSILVWLGVHAFFGIEPGNRSAFGVRRSASTNLNSIPLSTPNGELLSTPNAERGL